MSAVAAAESGKQALEEYQRTVAQCLRSIDLAMQLANQAGDIAKRGADRVQQASFMVTGDNGAEGTGLQYAIKDLDTQMHEVRRILAAAHEKTERSGRLSMAVKEQLNGWIARLRMPPR